MHFSLKALRARLAAPRGWPRIVRRLFVLSFPLSIPLWLFLCTSLALASGLHALFRPVISFWNAPPRQRHNYGYGYGYAHRSAAQAEDNVTSLPGREAA